MGELTQNGHEISGTTANQPDNVESGQQYFDETLGIFQVYSGSAWVTTLTSNIFGTYGATSISPLTSSVAIIATAQCGIIVGSADPLTISGLAAAAAGAGGAIIVSSAAGGATSGNSGALGLGTGATTDGVSGTIAITSGAAAGGTNDSGDITIDTGTSAGGSTGTIAIGLANATALTVGPATNFAVDAAGSDTYAITLDPALTQYITGQMFTLKVGTANTGACTLNINALGAKPIKTVSGADPVDNDLVTAGMHLLVYDGTNMVLINPATTTD